MVSSEDLYKVILSMTETEKNIFRARVIKLYPKGNLYVELFNIFNQMPEYSKKEFSDLTLQKNIVKVSSIQNSLKEILLEELAYFRMKSKPIERYRSILNKAEIFKKAGSNKTYIKYLDKALEFGQPYGYYTHMKKTLTFKILALEKELKTKSVKEEIERSKNKILILDKQREEFNIFLGCFEFVKFNLSNSFRLRDFEERNKVLEKIKIIKPFLKSKDLRLTYLVNVFFKEINYTFDKDYSIYSEKLFSFIHSNASILEFEMVNYLLYIYEYLECKLNFEEEIKLNEIFSKLDELLSFYTLQKNNQYHYKVNTYRIKLEFIYYCKIADVDTLEILIPKVKNHFLLSEDSEKNIFELFYKLPFVYFSKKDFSSALDWVSRCLDKSSKIFHIRKIYSYLKILEILIHFELENYLILNNLIDKNQKYIKSQNDYFESEKILFSLLNSKHFQTKGSLKLKPKLETTKNKLVLLYNEDEFEAAESKYIDYIQWIDDVISRI